MKNRTSNIPINERAARELFDRNIRLSRLIIAGDFEEVLADIILQFETPPRTRRGTLPAPMHARRIARSLQHGLLALPPNGLDFAMWLWDVAPLHFVTIPGSDEIGALTGFQAGVFQLRCIAAMIAERYCDMQPQKIESIIPLIDSSVDWVDARCLIRHTMLPNFRDRAVEDWELLETLARDKRVWRKLIALETAADLICVHPLQTARALSLVTDTFAAIGEEAVARGVRHALRCAALNGEQHAFAEWISASQAETHPEVRSIIAECSIQGSGKRETRFCDSVLPVLESWESSSQYESIPSIARAISELRTVSG